MSKQLKMASVLALVFLVMPTPAAASYLDPGLGSLLVQGLVASFAAAVATLAMYWRSVMSFARRLTGSRSQSKSSPRQ